VTSINDPRGTPENAALVTPVSTSQPAQPTTWISESERQQLEYNRLQQAIHNPERKPGQGNTIRVEQHPADSSIIMGPDGSISEHKTFESAIWENSAREHVRQHGSTDFLVQDSRGYVIDHRNGQGIADDNIITLPGSLQCRVADAVAAGLLHKEGNDYVYDPARQAAQAQAQKQRQVDQQKAAEAAIERLDGPAENLLGALTANLPNTSVASAMNQLIEEGAISDATAAQIASQLGVEPSDFAGYSERLVSSFQAQADAAVSSVFAGSIPADTVWEWARETQPAELKRAMAEQLHLVEIGNEL